ncbi:MAG: caspase family protein [Firmicutes bacterium]|nr:caspase family protein [Bacillota bacterium]
MKRHALILSNPGESGAENYCEGVNVDVNNYTSFLKSALGGTWYNNEITHLNRPSKLDTNNAIKDISSCDYSLIIFCGHGFYSASRESTILQLRKNEEIDFLDLKNEAKKRTIILDCCRKVEKDIITEERMIAKFSEAKAELNPLECRKFFEKQLEKCHNGIVVGYACSKNETAGDSQSKGGYYSYSLLKSATEWCETNNIDLTRKWSKLNIAEAHNASIKNVSRLSGGTQTPEIDKPRSGPYFPFAIMA